MVSWENVDQVFGNLVSRFKLSKYSAGAPDRRWPELILRIFDSLNLSKTKIRILVWCGIYSDFFKRGDKMRIPVQDEHDDYAKWLEHAIRVRTIAGALFERLADQHAPGRALFPIDVLEVVPADDGRSPQDFLIRTQLGTITARFEFAFIPRIPDYDDLGPLLNGVYKFFITQFDDTDKPVAKQICRIYFDPVNFRYGSDAEGFSGPREIRDNFARSVIAYVLGNFIDQIDRPGPALAV